MNRRHAAIAIAWGFWLWALYEWSLWSVPLALLGLIPYLLVLSAPGDD